MDRGLATELLLRKDGGKIGYIEDTKTCVSMEVRGCTGGGQSRNGPYVVPAWHSHRLVLGAISRGGGVRSKDYVCKDAVQGLGRGWAAVCGAAGLGCFAVMAQNDAKGLILCRGGGALGNSRMHAEGLNRVGRIVYGCVYCAHRVLSAEQVFGDTDGETGLLSMWETRTFEGTGGPEQSI